MSTWETQPLFKTAVTLRKSMCQTCIKMMLITLIITAVQKSGNWVTFLLEESPALWAHVWWPVVLLLELDILYGIGRRLDKCRQKCAPCNKRNNSAGLWSHCGALTALFKTLGLITVTVPFDKNKKKRKQPKFPPFRNWRLVNQNLYSCFYLFLLVCLLKAFMGLEKWLCAWFI